MTLEDKLLTAGSYILLAGRSLGDRSYGIIPPYKLDFVTIKLFLIDRDKLGYHSWETRFDGPGWTAWIGPATFPANDQEAAMMPTPEGVRFEVDGFGTATEMRNIAEQWLDRHQPHMIGDEYRKFLDTYPIRRLLRLFGVEMKPYQAG